MINTKQDSLKYIPRRHLRKRKSWTIIGLLPLEFQPRMTN